MGHVEATSDIVSGIESRKRVSKDQQLRGISRSALRSSESNERTFIGTVKPRTISRQEPRLAQRRGSLPSGAGQVRPFNEELDSCLEAISRSKSKLPMLRTVHDKFLNISGARGSVGSIKAKTRLQHKKEEQKCLEMRTLADFMCSENNPATLVRIHHLLKQRWCEKSSNYKILTKLTPPKQARLAKLLYWNNRRIA